ncbi:elongation of very long chain fatty acids protein 7-like [Spodoptera litura]|uniref:Elongation of very long chain fatty acids protein n=1 Tax=Spodoptera litura TaxID=69820 RepID=A0A9J7DPY9_SPOLT|nr:elongation of very long chain fatty acids protein 7-like [Spodoptera litura]
MAAIIDLLWQGYKRVFQELPDPRTRDWFLIAKPYQTLAILGLYLMFVLEWGPKFMKNRQPYNLDKILIVYNSFQVVACAYVFIRALQVAWLWDYKWICEPVDFSNSPQGLEIARICYYYFSLKIIDLLDTVFFVLRKKNNQVSFLHIYHHTGMCMLIWGAVTYLPGGHGTLIGVINSFVHVVMYAYYLLSVVMPSVKNSLRVKKHVTQLQILQFFWCVVHMAIIVFKSDCAYPRWTSAMFLPQNLFMLVLFVDFYIKTYIIKPRQQKKAQLETAAIVDQNNNDLPKNGNLKAANSLKNGKEISNEKTYVKNDLNKAVNGNGTSYNGFTGNVNIFENGNEKSNCGNCRANCHKHFKGE